MDRNHETRSFFRLFQLIVVLAWLAGFWGLCAGFGDAPTLGKFLRPDYGWIVQMGAAILVLFLISLVYCNPHHRGTRGLGLFLQMGIMVLPLLYLPTAVRSELSPEAAKKRSFSVTRTDLGAAKNAPDRAVQSGPTDAKTTSKDTKLSDKPSLLQLMTQAEQYKGKRVTAMGKVCLDDRLPASTFFCYQLLMTCCAADARPIGVLVHYDRMSAVKTGMWVKVTGTAGMSTFQDHGVVRIAAERVEPTAPPQHPYVWP